MLNNIASILGVSAPLVGDYESISTTTVGGAGSASVTFSSIPATYTHLQVRYSLLGAGLQYNIQINGDTGNNYSMHYINGDGATVTVLNAINTNKILQNFVTATSATNPTVGVTDVLDYANTNKYKTTRTLDGMDSNGSGQVSFVSGNWRSTSAITSITFNSGGTFTQYSTFALYGIK